MLFDETFDYLSHDLSIKILNVLKGMKYENTIVVISKNKDLITSEFVDNIIVLKDNKILKTGTKEEILNDKECKQIIKKL